MKQSEQCSYGCCFSGTIRPNKSKNLSPFNGYTDLVYSSLLTIRFGQRNSFDYVHGGCRLNSFLIYNALQPHPIKFATNFSCTLWQIKASLLSFPLLLAAVNPPWFTTS